MMRYFFNLEDGTCLRDAEGEELADDNAAAAIARKIAEELGRNNTSTEKLAVVVRDETGRTVAKIHMWPEEKEAASGGSLLP